MVRTVTITGTPASIDSILDTTCSLASQILITARGGDGAVNVGTVNVTGSLGAFNGAAVALSGDMTVSGTIALIRVASATSVSLNLDTANLAGPATNFFINVGSDLSVSTKAPIGSDLRRSLDQRGYQRGADNHGSGDQHHPCHRGFH